MDTKSRTDKEIQAYKIRTIIFLIIILALVVVAIWQFIELQEKIKELQDKSNIIALQDSVITQKATIERQKLELDTAIMLLSILVSEEDGQEMKPKDVLSGLNNLAAKVRKEKADYKARRKDLIEKVFSSSESVREEARRSLQKEYSDDKILATQLVKAAQGRIDMANKESVYQIIYILEQLSFQSLQKHKESIEKFFIDADAALLIGPGTKPRVDKIMERMNE